eukprot:scaffold2021_cov176-Amphora_coffeaeformis.AAC.18
MPINLSCSVSKMLLNHPPSKSLDCGISFEQIQERGPFVRNRLGAMLRRLRVLYALGNCYLYKWPLALDEGSTSKTR